MKEAGQGLAEEMDLVFVALLVSAHLAFWRIVLDTQFVNRVL